MSEKIDLAELKRLLKHLPARDPKTPIVGGGHTLREVIVVARDALQALSDRDARIRELESVREAARRFVENESAMKTEPTYDSQEADEEAVAAYNALYGALYPRSMTHPRSLPNEH